MFCFATPGAEQLVSSCVQLGTTSLLVGLLQPQKAWRDRSCRSVYNICISTAKQYTDDSDNDQQTTTKAAENNARTVHSLELSELLRSQNASRPVKSSEAGSTETIEQITTRRRYLALFLRRLEQPVSQAACHRQPKHLKH